MLQSHGSSSYHHLRETISLLFGRTSQCGALSIWRQKTANLIADGSRHQWCFLLTQLLRSLSQPGQDVVICTGLIASNLHKRNYHILARPFPPPQFNGNANGAGENRSKQQKPVQDSRPNDGKYQARGIWGGLGKGSKCVTRTRKSRYITPHSLPAEGCMTYFSLLCVPIGSPSGPRPDALLVGRMQSMKPADTKTIGNERKHTPQHLFIAQIGA